MSDLSATLEDLPKYGQLRALKQSCPNKISIDPHRNDSQIAWGHPQ